ncbi:MAG: hypothetical protein GY737_27755 [Desulfobacteraceae bacterium]|nr:hypothetical protein [Desulfobacteraceae bacterium]
MDNFRTISLKFKEVSKIMEAADLNPDGTGVPAEAGVKKAALLKFLRHLYLVGERGSQQVWILSTPAAYTKYPQCELLDAKASFLTVKAKLADITEKFNTTTRKRLGEATQLGLAWVEAAKIVLTRADSDAQSMAKVKRWFASDTTSAEDLNQTIKSVLAGFKKMANSLNGNLVVITDLPQKRGDSNQEYTIRSHQQ